ncbi:glycoside hydrolase family 31 protein [Ophiostoma piceae UAMH 11346]|uniref:alpha-glucosidase n=1 Tax=Ophiostoma piceae (strain UAMH 11346) TaxID=1262450 RepID=S3CQ47_OPHP1|nr:glycoside hydrolase family 31 protein [Ophiostoma piceae UAMH 11346]
MRSSVVWACLAAALLPQSAVAVKEHDFKKCDQSGFCKRNRALADNAAASGADWASPYTVLADSASVKDGQFQATILKTINAQGDTVRLPLTVSFTQSGVARVTVDEERRQNKDIELRHDSKVRKERYNEAEKLVLVGGLELDKTAAVVEDDFEASTNQKVVRYGPEGQFEAHIQYSPFSVEFKRDGATEIKINDRGLFNMDHWRAKVEPKEGDATDAAANEDDGTLWEETFGGNTDTKPRGPESVGLDISFVGYDHVYGIPSHTGPLSLKETRGGDGKYSEPYRLYNLDVFEYILDSPMTLYGAIPFMQAHRQGSTVGVFWLNAAETWIDITKQKVKSNPMALGAGAETDTQTHWMSESGLLDVFVFLGPTTQDVLKNYGELTGYTALPQESAIGYQQCRWNYVSDDDVKDVDRKMDKFGIPYDIIWLDIEYTDGKKYFTWDEKFADPKGMVERLDEHGRKLVVIIDPHIKNVDNYPVVAEMKQKELAVKNKDGSIFEGWCWPGSSHWIDAFNPKAIDWWKTLFTYASFKGTAENVFIWNDMNEPSVFNGPETTMPKDNVHHDGWEHRDVHNLNGMTFHNATYQALLSRKAGELRRPFILTRSFFAGSQRLGAMWTGDNQASWDHLAAATPMLLSQGIAGFPFAGADVGGFFGNPDKELQTRWYQAGVFYPFFRGHAHIDSRRREPYMAGEPYTTIITAALRLRYSLLPAFYTAFHAAHTDGTPILKPLFYTHPDVESAFAVDDEFFVGSTGLLVKPIVDAGKEVAAMYIPDAEVYYDYFDYSVVPTEAGKVTQMPAPLDTIPVLMRGGHAFARRDQPRRSSQLMKFDDYTLVAALSKSGKAEGELYVDDGDSFDYEKGQYIHQRFVLEGSTVSSKAVDAPPKKAGKWLKAMDDVHVDKIVVVGAPASWSGFSAATVTSGGKTWTAPLDYVPPSGGRAAFAIVRHVGVRVGADWEVAVV